MGTAVTNTAGEAATNMATVAQVAPTPALAKTWTWPKWLSASIVVSIMAAVFAWGFDLSKTVSAQGVSSQAAKSKADAAEDAAKKVADKVAEVDRSVAVLKEAVSRFETANSSDHGALKEEVGKVAAKQDVQTRQLDRIIGKLDGLAKDR